MKILIYSRAFRPSVGGLETMMEILAEEFVAAGHQVLVVTESQGPLQCDGSYKVVRRPSFKSYLKLLRWSDICLYASVSLRGLWPMIVAPRPFAISHQTVYDSSGFNMPASIKRFVTRFSNNIAISRSVQSRIPGRSTIIPNTYD